MAACLLWVILDGSMERAECPQQLRSLPVAGAPGQERQRALIQSRVRVLFRQRRVQHTDDAPNLEASGVGIGFFDLLAVGRFVIDDDHAKQLFLSRIST